MNFHSTEFLDISFLTLAGCIFGVLILLAIVIVKESNLNAIGISVKSACSIAILIFGASWLISNNYFRHNFEQLYKVEHNSAAIKQKVLFSKIHDKIESAYLEAQSLSKNDLIQAALQKSKTQALKTDELKQISSFLKQAAEHSKSDSALIINANGDCISTNDNNHDFNLIGSNFSKSDFFYQANAGKKTLTYWKGNRQRTPELLVASPVLQSGKYIGSIVFKVDIAFFSQLMLESHAFVTDTNGVIVIAYDKRLELNTLNKSDSLSRETKKEHYGTETLKSLKINPWLGQNFPQIVSINNNKTPVILNSSPLEFGGLKVYTAEPIDKLISLDTKSKILFVIILISGSALVLIILIAYFFFSRLVNSKKELEIAAMSFEVQDGIIIADERLIVIRINQALTKITGYEADDLVGKQLQLFDLLKFNPTLNEEIWESVNVNGSWSGEFEDLNKHGDPFTKSLAISLVKDPQGKKINYIISIRDVTETKWIKSQNNKLLFSDILTGLPNRLQLQSYLMHAINTSKANDKKGAVLLIDLDNFKNLNDTLGHHVGDLYLKEIADRLQSNVRINDIVGRLGGDEFIIILEHLSSDESEAIRAVKLISNKLLSKLSEPCILETHRYQGQCSIGVTLFGGTNVDVGNLLKQAEICMFEAKNKGRNNVQIFEPKMEQVVSDKASLLRDLQIAIKKKQLELYYQVQVNSAKETFGVEALVRWIHPKRGVISPIEFIPLAEETGLIVPIGEWVLDKACAQIKAWEVDAKTNRLVVSINVSSKQIHDEKFPAQVRKAIQKHEINPKNLKLELTESSLLEGVEANAAIMSLLKKDGVQLSLDDFGTGYSSLQYLKQLPLDEIKIDRSFVKDITSDNQDRSIVKTIITLAESVGMSVLAEGVETEEQLDVLLKNGCQRFQGYLFGSPVPIDILIKTLK